MRCEEQRLPDVQYSWQDCEAMCCAAMPIICVMQADADGTDTAAAIAGYFVGLVHQIQSLGLITGCRRQGHAASSLHRPPDYDENEEESEEWRELASEIEGLVKQKDAELFDAIVSAQAAHTALSAVQGASDAPTPTPAARPGSGSDTWRDFAWKTIRPRLRRLWTGHVTADAQLFIIDTCLLAGTRVAMARVAAVDLLCRKELFLTNQHSRRAMLEALANAAALDRQALRHAIEAQGFAGQMRKHAGVAELPSQAIARQNSRPPPTSSRAQPAPAPAPTPAAASPPASVAVPAPVPAPAAAVPPPAPSPAPMPTAEPEPAQPAPAASAAQGSDDASAAASVKEKAATSLQSAWRGKAIRKLMLVQRATDTGGIMRELLAASAAGMRAISGTPEPGS